MDVYVREWLPSTESAKFVFFINHGVAEHSARYAELANRLTALGGKVVAQDHRGHGLTAKKLNIPLGQFTEDDPMKAIIYDCKQLITSTMSKEPPGTPWFLFGHSMGTVIAQHALQQLKNHEILKTLKAVILSGPPAVPSAVEMFVFKILLRILILVNRGQWIVRALTFDKHDKEIRRLTGQPNLPKNTWLNSINERAEEYNNDPMCGQHMSFKFWLSALHRISELTTLDFTLPNEQSILILGGDMDGVTEFGKSLDVVKDRLNKHSKAKLIELMLFNGARHEVLREQMKDLVFDRLINWIQLALQ